MQMLADVRSENVDADYIYRVQDDSMIGKGIYKGCRVYVREQSDVQDGEIALVKVNGEHLIRTLKHVSDDEIELETANPRYRTRYAPKDQVGIIGTIVNVVAPLGVADPPDEKEYIVNAIMKMRLEDIIDMTRMLEKYATFALNLIYEYPSARNEAFDTLASMKKIIDACPVDRKWAERCAENIVNRTCEW